MDKSELLKRSISYRIYGNKNKTGWVKIKEVKKVEHIQEVLDDMAESELFIGYIVIKNTAMLNQDEPFKMGNFYQKTKKLTKKK